MRWKLLLILLLVVLPVVTTVAAFAIYVAAHKVPTFYEQTLVLDAEAARQTSQEMVQQTASLVSDAQRPGDWEAVFTEEQINGWFAVDLVENHLELLPENLSHPRIDIRSDGITIAARHMGRGLQSVLSLEFEPMLLEDNELAIRLRRARAGSVPLPLSQVLDTFKETAENLEWPMEWRQSSGDPVAILTIPKLQRQGEKQLAVEVTSLELHDGKIYFGGRSQRVN